MPTTTEEKKEPLLLETKKEYEFPFTLGADPEFTVISGTRPMNAEDIFKTFFKDMKKGDHGFILPGGNIGWDNHPATGELRPDPGSPRKVVENLKLLFEEAHKRMPFVDLTTLTVAASTGGHIHLSIPEGLADAATQRTPKWAAIERAVGTFLLMIMMGENALSREMRKRGGNYGDLLDFRLDQKFTYPNGTPGLTLEVRGPTAEWITSEKIALGTLAYIAIAWDQIVKGDLKAISPVIFRNKTQANETVTPLLNNFANMQKLYLNKMRPFIRSHPAYRDYKNALELIMSPERVIAEKKRVHYCINEGWGFSKESKNIPTNKFLDNEKIEEATSKFPEQVIRNMSQFAWNDDLHVEQFATGLSKRCIALGWKPKHEYFLFGMKKGITPIIMRDESGNFVAGTEAIKTQEDYLALKKKFSRLGEKATPIYGRFIHPRTGELANKEDERRVMIGLPYELRQKGDLRPLIRLVLRFEKNPKEFPALDAGALPMGKGELAEQIKKDEEVEIGVARAEERGEDLRNLPHDLQAGAEEEMQERQGEAILISDEGSLILTQKFAELSSIISSGNTDEMMESEESLTTAIDNIIGHDRRWPRVPDDITRDMVLRGFVGTIMHGRVLNRAAKAYLLCAGLGESPSASVQKEADNFMHRIGYNSEREQYFIETDSRTVGEDGRGWSESIGPILDLIGITGDIRMEVEDVLREEGRMIEVQINPTIGLRPGRLTRLGGRTMVNPHPNLPHLWPN